jgi:hypothetical protein
MLSIEKLGRLMGQKLPPREAELYKRCDEVLHYIWDPIGVAGSPGARDEYDSYLPRVFASVRDNADPGEIVAYLLQVEEKSMGLSANPERARKVVDVLREWREWIWDHGAD